MQEFQYRDGDNLRQKKLRRRMRWQNRAEHDRKTITTAQTAEKHLNSYCRGRVSEKTVDPGCGCRF